MQIFLLLVGLAIGVMAAAPATAQRAFDLSWKDPNT